MKENTFFVTKKEQAILEDFMKSPVDFLNGQTVVSFSTVLENGNKAEVLVRKDYDSKPTDNYYESSYVEEVEYDSNGDEIGFSDPLCTEDCLGEIINEKLYRFSDSEGVEHYINVVMEKDGLF